LRWRSSIGSRARSVCGAGVSVTAWQVLWQSAPGAEVGCDRLKIAVSVNQEMANAVNSRTCRLHDWRTLKNAAIRSENDLISYIPPPGVYIILTANDEKVPVF
jgi:hypothetical protein